MRKVLIFGAVLSLLLSAACAKKAGKKPSGVVHQSSTVRFTGYKITVEAKAPPAEVEQWLRDWRNLDAAAGPYRLRILSQNKIEKLGDSVDGRVEIAGVGMTGKIILVHRKPASQLWFLFNGARTGLGMLRYEFKEIPAGTRVSLRFEVGELDPFLAGLAGDSLQQAVGRLMEKGIANGQAYFDPSLSAEELMARGIRGEFYNTFYQGHRTEVWINSPPEKIADYLLNPDVWQAYKEKYGTDFSKCMVSASAEPCPMKFKIFGMDYDITSFPTSYQYADNSVSFWLAKQMIARFKILLQPESGGARLTVDYIMELPPSFAQEGGPLLMNIIQIPSMLEQLLSNVKKDVENPSVPT